MGPGIPPQRQAHAIRQGSFKSRGAQALLEFFLLVFNQDRSYYEVILLPLKNRLHGVQNTGVASALLLVLLLARGDQGSLPFLY